MVSLNWGEKNIQGVREKYFKHKELKSTCLNKFKSLKQIQVSNYKVHVILSVNNMLHKTHVNYYDTNTS